MPTLHDAGSPAAQVAALIASVRRRVIVREILLAAAAALLGCLAVEAIAYMTPWPASIRLASAIVAAVTLWIAVWWLRRSQRTSRAAARHVESAYPSLRNLAITAEELIDMPGRVRPYMLDRVMASAAGALARVHPARVVPVRREILLVAGAALVLAVPLPVSPPRHGSNDASRPESRTALRSPSVDVVVALQPPAYTKRPIVTLRNPQSIDALAGSTAAIRVTGKDPAVRINGAPAALQDDGTARAVLTESGYVAIDASGEHRVLPLTVTPDARPVVRVTSPGKDLRLADARATIPLHVTATDDLDLASLDVRYTVVSGGGEQFTFVEGTLPAALVKESGRAWHADASLALASLKLEPGDALIYRAVAADARGAAGEASSDTYFVEVAGPGDVALDGVEMPPDKERYALSQAMVVVKIQRLIAREAGMRRAELAESVANIAAEQRAVRANFIFLLGGEVEDEVVEAEASHEIQEGRLANQARREIVAAIVLMAKVEQSLAALSPRTALPPAQDAVRALQRAFGHSRYLLRALPARVRVDPARRLSGDLAAVRDWQRELAPARADARAAAARAALAEAAAISRQPSSPDAPARLAALAERALAIEPGAADLHAASRQLLEARDAFSRGDTAKGRAALQAASAPLLVRAQRDRVDGPFAAPDALRLAGAAALVPGGSR